MFKRRGLHCISNAALELAWHRAQAWHTQRLSGDNENTHPKVMCLCFKRFTQVQSVGQSDVSEVHDNTTSISVQNSVQWCPTAEKRSQPHFFQIKSNAILLTTESVTSLSLNGQSSNIIPDVAERAELKYNLWDSGKMNNLSFSEMRRMSWVKYMQQNAFANEPCILGTCG